MLLFRGLGFANAPLLVELLAEHFDHDRRNPDVHHPGGITDADLQADRHDGLVGRQDLEQLRLGFVTLDGEIQRRDGVPGGTQIMQDYAQQPFENALLDLRYFARQFDCGLAGAAKEHFENREDERRIDLQDRVAVVRPHPQRDHAGRRGQTLGELHEGELFDTNEVHRNIGAQIGGQAGSQAAGEVLMEQVNRPELIFRDAVGPAKIVGLGPLGEFLLGVLSRAGNNFGLLRGSNPLCGHIRISAYPRRFASPAAVRSFLASLPDQTSAYKIFTARAARIAIVASEIDACSIIRTFAHRDRTGTSVGENAVLVLNARNK